MCVHCEIRACIEGLRRQFGSQLVDFVFTPKFTDNLEPLFEAPGPSIEEQLGNVLSQGVNAEPEAGFMSEAQAAEYVASQPAGSVFVDATGSEWTDLSSEAYRTYVYPDGIEYTVVGPQLLTISQSGSHRVFDDQGQSHWVRGDFTAITWRAKPGKPNFVK